MTKQHDTISTRLALILTKLNNGERLQLDELALEFNVSKRTIQRDLNERLSYLPIEKQNNSYFMSSYALGKLNFEDIKNFAQLCGINSLYPSFDDKFIVDILNSKINKAYLIKNQGFEDISHLSKSFEELSSSILRFQIVSFFYNDKKRVVNPYKLINNNGIWYLLADENDKLKTYTFTKIEKLKLLENKIFEVNKTFAEQIDKNQTNWFAKEPIEVLFEVREDAIEYFLRKEILANKKIIEKSENRLLISTEISYDNEMLRVAKYWLPCIKIISPAYLQEKFVNILKQYIKTTQADT